MGRTMGSVCLDDWLLDAVFWIFLSDGKESCNERQ
jgi:hypothetical protein